MGVKQLVLTLVPKMSCVVAARGLRVGLGEPAWLCWGSKRIQGCPEAVNFLEVLLCVAGLVRARWAAQAAWAMWRQDHSRRPARLK